MSEDLGSSQKTRIKEVLSRNQQLEIENEELRENYTIQVFAFRQQTVKLQEIDQNNSSLIEENASLAQQNAALAEQSQQLQLNYDDLLAKFNEITLQQGSSKKISLSQKSSSHVQQQQQQQLSSQQLREQQSTKQDERFSQANGQTAGRQTKQTRDFKEDFEISQEQIQKINAQVEEFLDRVPPSIQKDLTNLAQTRLILSELIEESSYLGLSQQIQANFEMFSLILTDSIQVFKRYSDIRQENRILNQKLSNLEKQFLNEEQRHSQNNRDERQLSNPLQHRVGDLQKEKAHAQKQAQEIMSEMNLKETVYLQSKKTTSMLLTENEKLKGQIFAQQKVIDRMRGGTPSASTIEPQYNNSDSISLLNIKTLEQESAALSLEKKNLENIILNIVSKISNEKSQQQVLEILELNRQKEQIHKQSVEFEDLLEKYEMDLKSTVKNDPLREENIALRKNIETNRLKFAKSAQAIKILDMKIEKQIQAIPRIEFFEAQKQGFDVKMNDVKEQLNDLKNYVYQQ